MICKEYLDGRIKLYNCDCFELIQQLEDKSIDLVLTDPPYLYSDYSAGNKGFDEKQENIDFIKKISAGIDFWKFFDICKNKQKYQNLFIFCSNKQIPEVMKLGYDNKLQTNLLVWKKGGRPFGKTYLHDAEFICHIRKTGSPFNGAYNSRIFEYMSRRDTGHPTQKPLKLFNKLISFGSNEDDLVFDGFLGSGTTAIACIKNNRKFIGCEIEPAYFDIACNRIEAELKQLDFFRKTG